MFFLILLLLLICAAIAYFTFLSERVKYYKTEWGEYTAQEIAAEFAETVWAGSPIMPVFMKYPESLKDKELFHKISAAVVSALFAYQLHNADSKWQTQLLGEYKNKIGCEGKYIFEQQIGNIIDDIYNCKYEDCISECDKKIDKIIELMEDLNINLCEPNLKAAIIATSAKHQYAQPILNKVLKYYKSAQDAAV
jgi:hypothetical protein